jgi:hypothetical protein
VRLFAIYSVFEGEELLEGSIAQIRPLVDFVFCSVQTVSYSGEVYEGALEKCRELKRCGLVDQVATYTPQENTRGQLNELRKRFGAIQLGFKAGFTHFIQIDCDEYFVPEQFAAAKEFVASGDADVSIIYSQMYFKRPDWELDNIDDAFFPFICAYKPDLACVGSNFPYKCDPTRTVNANKISIVPREMLLQHHYSWVRNDIGRKFRNHSCYGTFLSTGILEDYNAAQVGSYVRLLKRHIRQGKDRFDIRVPEGSTD